MENMKQKLKNYTRFCDLNYLYYIEYALPPLWVLRSLKQNILENQKKIRQKYEAQKYIPIDYIWYKYIILHKKCSDVIRSLKKASEIKTYVFDAFVIKMISETSWNSSKFHGDHMNLNQKVVRQNLMPFG